MSGPILYTYVWNNPTNDTDPTGFEAQTSAQKKVTDAVAQALKDGITDLRIDENGNIVGTAPSSTAGSSSAAHGANFKADATNTTHLLAEAEHTSDHKAVLEAQKKRAENDAGKADGQNEKPPLQLLHSDSTIKSPSSNYESLKKEPTESIVKSLKPGQPEPLKVTEDGKVMDGNTRVKILQERGVEVNNLPRTTYKKSGLGSGALSIFGVGMVVELLDAIQKLPAKDAPEPQPTPQAPPQGTQH